MKKENKRKSKENKSKKPKDKDSSKEEVCEIFEVEKKGKTEIVKKCGDEEIKNSVKNQVKTENKILRNVLVGIGILALIFLSIVLIVNSTKHFEYKGVGYDITAEGTNLIFYKTSIPVAYQGHIVPYNFYIRNDPRRLTDVDFQGEILLLNNMVVNMTENFDCQGEGMIAIANLLNLYNVIGVNAIQDSEASCDIEGNYSYLEIRPGEKSKIIQTGPSCYELIINNCEILKVTEKFMVETFSKIAESKNDLIFSID